MQSDAGKRLIEERGATAVGIDTILLIKDGEFYERTDAALEISKSLTGFWYLFNVFRVLPRPVRDYFYSLFARNRYALFGKRDTCMIPTPEVRSRFIE
jgi:predicted DCC family thiol-disulfide oxidoreductase YuxK